jgi:hypothetical protein
MRHFFSSLLVLTALVSFNGCSSDSKPATTVAKEAGAPQLPTFSRVYDEVIKKGGCSQVQCHSAALRAGGLRLDSKATAYDNLVGQKAAGPCIKDAGGTGDGAAAMTPGTTTSTVCGCGPSGLTRVVAGNPDESLLVEKLADNAPCGERMPQTGLPVSAEQLDLVKQWITAGANND